MPHNISTPNDSYFNAEGPAIWACFIGTREAPRSIVPEGSNAVMRKVVADAFYVRLGVEHEFIFSGWGRTYIDERHLAEMENRPLHPAFATAYARALTILEGILGEPFRVENQRQTAVLENLAELIFWRGQKNLETPIDGNAVVIPVNDTSHDG